MSSLTPSVPVIDRVVARAFTIPTDGPEADGTLAWNRTTLVMAEVCAAGETGTGYSYTDAAAAPFVNETLAPVLLGGDAFAITKLWQDLVRAVRNIGRRGLAATAISALDIALWDLKARLLDLPLTQLLGAARPAVPIYGSGGFTSYSQERLQEQLSGWIERDRCSW
jgi:L-alanine-DL-glutamate epimerase-like enolase superfamily enzyme